MCLDVYCRSLAGCELHAEKWVGSTGIGWPMQWDPFAQGEISMMGCRQHVGEGAVLLWLQVQTEACSEVVLAARAV